MNIEKIETIPGLYYVKNVIKNINIIDKLDKNIEDIPGSSKRGDNNNWVPLTNSNNRTLWI